MHTPPPLPSTSHPPMQMYTPEGHTSRNVRGTAVTPYNNDALFLFWYWTHVHHVCAPCTSIMAHWPYPIACVLPTQKWVGRVFPCPIHCRSLCDSMSQSTVNVAGNCCTNLSLWSSLSHKSTKTLTLYLLKSQSGTLGQKTRLSARMNYMSGLVLTLYT